MPLHFQGREYLWKNLINKDHPLTHPIMRQRMSCGLTIRPKTDLADLKTDLANLETRLFRWFVGLTFTAIIASVTTILTITLRG